MKRPIHRMGLLLLLYGIFLGSAALAQSTNSSDKTAQEIARQRNEAAQKQAELDRMKANSTSGGSENDARLSEMGRRAEEQQRKAEAQWRANHEAEGRAGRQSEELRRTMAEKQRLADLETGKRFLAFTQWYKDLVYSGLPRTQPGFPADQLPYQFPQHRPLDSGRFDDSEFVTPYLKHDLGGSFEREKQYGLADENLADFGAAAGLLLWDYSEFLTEYQPFDARRSPDSKRKWQEELSYARAMAIEVLRYCRSRTLSKECGWTLREILRWRRDAIPVELVDVSKLEHDAAANSLPVREQNYGTFDSRRLGVDFTNNAGPGLDVHWKWRRTQGKSETAAYRKAHGLPVKAGPATPAS